MRTLSLHCIGVQVGKGQDGSLHLVLSMFVPRKNLDCGTPSAKACVQVKDATLIPSPRRVYLLIGHGFLLIGFRERSIRRCNEILKQQRDFCLAGSSNRGRSTVTGNLCCMVALDFADESLLHRCSDMASAWP